jgi:hypothetical protein
MISRARTIAEIGEPTEMRDDQRIVDFDALCAVFAVILYVITDSRWRAGGMPNVI